MPVTLYPTTLKYKTTDGTFESATAIKGDSGAAIIVQVEGTSPTIVCEDNHRYICGEVLSIEITPCASGICDVVFTSGSTAAVLTIPNTVKWANGFDPSALDVNTVYEVNIMDGTMGVAASWT